VTIAFCPDKLTLSDSKLIFLFSSKNKLNHEIVMNLSPAARFTRSRLPLSFPPKPGFQRQQSIDPFALLPG
jgi:hypothetical protein